MLMGLQGLWLRCVGRGQVFRFQFKACELRIEVWGLRCSSRIREFPGSAVG